tara:strand:+ start:1173 stop:2273 length:1101 start_codon:yes stop_codon:yes gene_type:complete
MITSERALKSGKVFLHNPSGLDGRVFKWDEDLDTFNGTWLNVDEVEVATMGDEGNEYILYKKYIYLDLYWLFDHNPNEQKEYTPKVGDYILTSELDTEEKHNFARKKMTIAEDNPDLGGYASSYSWHFLIISKGGCLHSDLTLETKVTLADLGWVDVEVIPVLGASPTLELSDLIEGETYRINRPDDYKTCESPTWNSLMDYLVGKEVPFSKRIIQEENASVGVGGWSIHPNWLVHVHKVVCDEVTKDTDFPEMAMVPNDVGGVDVITSEPDETLAPHKSDGGASEYYKKVLPQWLLDKQAKNGFIMIEDLGEVLFSNDFNYTNIFKAQSRMYSLEQGGGKEGNSFEYDANKCKYYTDKQLEVFNR